MIALADVGISVSDAKASAQWWKDKVGFAVQVLPGADHAVLVAPPGDRFILHLCEGFEPVDPGNTGVAFVTTETERTVAGMVEHGVRFTEPLRLESWGGMAKFADPDGNVFWLLQAPESMIRQTMDMRAPGGDRPTKRRSGAPHKVNRSAH